MNFNHEKEVFTNFIDLNEVESCKLVITADGNSSTIVKIEFEFQFKKNKKTEFVSFYKIEDDQMNQVCLYEDHQLAKKWREIIQVCISSLYKV